MYYYDVCASMNAFQKEQELSDAEFCACLYDFCDSLLIRAATFPLCPSSLRAVTLILAKSNWKRT
jgi:hypothetical protein